MLELFFSLRQSLPKNPPWKKTHKNAFLVLNIIKIQLYISSYSTFWRLSLTLQAL